MATRCTKHGFEMAAACCRTCGDDFCEECLVYAHGPARPPFCVPCALVAAGVRRHSASERRMHRSRRRVASAPAVPPDTDDGIGDSPVDALAVSAGRSRVGPLAAVACAICVAVPLISHLA